MFGGVKNYVQDQVTLAKLEVVEGVGKAAGTVVVIIFMALFGLFFFTFLGLAGAYYLSIYFESHIYGFLAMAGMFLLLLILFAVFKKAVQNVVANIIVAATMGGKKVKKK